MKRKEEENWISQARRRHTFAGETVPKILIEVVARAGERAWVVGARGVGIARAGQTLVDICTQSFSSVCRCARDRSTPKTRMTEWF